ncbi:class I SAM-dependent methyltransferase [Leptothermofonsia sp. ETS-13]|uniref:class I SAM-dependent methyltransferase n=1 Tax=Leptothermofonsia sp. ETS-13 TaxID=3035696 RepID=UPI003BA225FA
MSQYKPLRVVDMAAQLGGNSSNFSTLGILIVQRIAESPRFRIPFFEFMELALYHPLHGYYASSASQIGTRGDFFTSPHLGADFGELLAEQFVQMWEVMGQPHPFLLVEMGAGQGLLASDILGYVQKSYPSFFESLEYLIIERAAALMVEQRRQLKPLEMMGNRLRWCRFEDLPAESITGCFFSNELVDALPVHQVILETGQLREVYVTVQPEAEAEVPFVEVVGDLSTPYLVKYFDQVGINLFSGAYPNGYRTEVNLAALDWMTTVAEKLKRGYVLTIDYGYTSDRYYHPMRSQGTLQCYYRHRHHSNPYIYVGEQDITAHVDFTALQRQGERWGLRTLGFTKQGMFLMALGLGDRLAALSQSETSDPQAIVEILRRRDALQQLVNPVGLGNFGVLIQGKGVENNEPLKGLRQE